MKFAFLHHSQAIRCSREAALQVNRRLADLLMGHAASRLRRRHREWADAMASESAAILSDGERLRWSLGCALASYQAPGAFSWAVYPAMLLTGTGLMAAYQWSADESLRTVAVLSLIGLALGGLQPKRSLISGAAVGLVVTGVNGFETISTIHRASCSRL
jgi:hypothetical protein